jgi:hypothetical protein
MATIHYIHDRFCGSSHLWGPLGPSFILVGGSKVSFNWERVVAPGPRPAKPSFLNWQCFHLHTCLLRPYKHLCTSAGPSHLLFPTTSHAHCHPKMPYPQTHGRSLQVSGSIAQRPRSQ